jgi:hypothetical protein
MQVRQSIGRGLSNLVHWATAVGAIAAIVSMQKAQLNQPALGQQNLQRAEQQESARLGVLKQLPNLGFNLILADWTFLNFLQYYGDTEVRDKTGYALAPQYFDVITQRDPRFVDSYLFLSGAVSYQLGLPKVAIEYMQRGTDALSPHMHPRAFSVWWFQAIDQLLLVGDVPATIHAYKMASVWAKGSSEPQFQDFAPLYAKTAEFLIREPSSKFVRFNAWSGVYGQATAINDRKTQIRARLEILALGGIEKTDSQGRTFFVFPPQTRAKSSPAPKLPTKPGEKVR